MNSSDSRNMDRAIVAAVTLLAAWLRLNHLGQPSLWWDEFITVGASLRPLADMLQVLKYVGPNDTGVELFPPLTHVITHFLAQAARSDVLLRLPGALAGVAAIPLTWLLCRKPLGRLSAHTACMLLALSVYHIHYSRELRPYAIFLTENILALHLLHTGLTQGRRALLLAWGAVAAAMLYTSYMAATLLFAQTAFAGVYLAGMAARGDRMSAMRLALPLGLGLAAAGACYLPWAQGQLLIYKLLHDPNFQARFTLDFVDSALREFAGFAYRGNFPYGWLLAGLGAAGWVAAFALRGRSFALLLVVWAFMPVAGIFLAKARMELSSRYLVTVYFFLIVFAGHLLATTVKRAAAALFGNEPIPAARLTAAAFLALLLSVPNSTSLRDYYSRETSHFKELAAWLVENRDNKDLIVFNLPRNLKLILDWYGQGLPRMARKLEGGGYLSAFLLAAKSEDAAGRTPQALFMRRMEDVDILALGIARTPETPMAPAPDGRFVYRDNYSGFRFLEECLESSNMSPSPLSKTLTRHDNGLPAQAAYRFRPLPALTTAKASLTLVFSARLTEDTPTDDVFTVSLAPQGENPVELKTVTMDSFKNPDGTLVPANHEKKRFMTCTLDLTERVSGKPFFDVRLGRSSTTRSGSIELEDFRLEAVLDGPAPPRDALPKALLSQLPVVRYVADVNMILSHTVYAFSLDGGVESPGVGSPGQLADYLKAYPGAKPVRVLPYADGAPAVAIYDPALGDPWLHVAPGVKRLAENAPGRGLTAAAVKVRGTLSDPVLRIGRLDLPLPVSCPIPGELAVNPNRQGELAVSPLFTSEGIDPAAQTLDRARRNNGEDCLSCEPDGPCSVTYRMVSGLPVTAIRITAFPRVESQPGGTSFVRTQISLDGGPFREVNRYEGSGSGRWEGWKIPQYTALPLETPAREVRVRFVLSGAKAQLWSAPDAAMRMEFRLDASSVSAPFLDAWPVWLGADNPSPLDILFMNESQPFPDRFRRSR